MSVCTPVGVAAFSPHVGASGAAAGLLGLAWHRSSKGSHYVTRCKRLAVAVQELAFGLLWSLLINPCLVYSIAELQ